MDVSESQNHSKRDQKKKKKRKKNEESERERLMQPEDDVRQLPSTSSTSYLASPFTSLKEFRKHKMSDSSDDFTSVPKKKHKKANADDTTSEKGSVSTKSTKDCKTSTTKLSDANAKKRKKKKKKKEGDFEKNGANGRNKEAGVSENVSGGVALNEHKSKHKKKKKRKKREGSSGNEITLDMLNESNTESISELAEKIANKANSNNPAMRSSTPTRNHHLFFKEAQSTNEDATPSKLKAQSKVKGQTGQDVLDAASTSSASHVPSSKTKKKSKKPNGKRKTSSTTVNALPQQSDIDGDVDGDLERLNASTVEDELDETLPSSIVDFDDPEVQSWLKSLEDDMVEDELDFNPPELHKRIPRLRGSTNAEKEKLKSEGVYIRVGKWTRSEDNIIKENLERFARKHNVPVPHILLGINKNNKEKMDAKLVRYLQLKKFSFELARNLPTRTLFSTYLRARKIFNPMNQSKLTKEQLCELFRFQRKVGKKWSTISDMMDKPAFILREAARYHEEKRELGTWTGEENDRLLDAVKEKLSFREDGSCRKLPWKKIAKKVGTRNKGQCCKQWLHNLCWKFARGNTFKPKWTDEDSFRLLEHLLQLDAETEADLDWDAIFSKFSNVASYSELVYKWYLLKSQVPDYKEKDLEDLIHFLQEKLKKKMEAKKNQGVRT